MRRHDSINSINMDYLSGSGVVFLRAILIFGSAAVMLGCILIPLLMKRADNQLADSIYVNQHDFTVTGSIKSDRNLALPRNTNITR